MDCIFTNILYVKQFLMDTKSEFPIKAQQRSRTQVLASILRLAYVKKGINCLNSCDGASKPHKFKRDLL